MDDLIERLRRRAADPERRNDAPRPTAGSTFASIDLGSLFGGSSGGLGGLGATLGRVVAANQAGRPIAADDLDLAEGIATPAPAAADALPEPASEATLAAAETRLGRRLPVELRRVWGDVANGGFGPGGGLASVAAALERYASLTAEPVGPRGQAWPATLLPIVLYDPDCDTIDLDTGAVIAWDVEEAWSRAFHEVAPSLDAYLEAWLGAPTAHEQLEARVAASNLEQARAARAHIATLSPEERAAMGLPEVGWERVVWGGLGLDDGGTDR